MKFYTKILLTKRLFYLTVHGLMLISNLSKKYYRKVENLNNKQLLCFIIYSAKSYGMVFRSIIITSAKEIMFSQKLKLFLVYRRQTIFRKVQLIYNSLVTQICLVHPTKRLEFDQLNRSGPPSTITTMSCIQWTVTVLMKK